MPINLRTDYGIRLVFEIAKMEPGTRATVRRLAEAASVPYDYARTIVRELVAAGVMNSHRGVGGGVELARHQSEISVLDVFRAMQEPASLALCTDAGGVCGRVDLCPMHVSVWRELDGIIERYLGEVTFADMVRVAATLPSTPEECD